MTLSTDEKSMLQQALCAGAFGNLVQGSNGQSQPGINPAVLDAVAALTDEQARQVLRSYQATQALNLNNHISQLNAFIAKAQTDLTALNAIVITPPPSA